MSKSFLKLLIGLSFLSLLCWGITTHTRFIECLSGSLKGVRYALFFKSQEVHLGDIVYIHDHAPAYVGEELFVKRILGMPGDKITRNNRKIHIESHTLEPKALESKTLGSKTPRSQKSLFLLSQTKEGKPLTPLTETSVPIGYVFVGGDHIRSFDSRYKEFGLVPLDKIWGKAIVVFSDEWPLFRWVSQIWKLINKGEK